MSAYEGLHPAVGALDVCPLVWLDPADRDAARARPLAPSPSGSARSASRSSSTASWPPPPSAASAPTSATAAWPSSGCGWRAASCAPDHGPDAAAPARRRHPGHRPPAARRLQRRARQRRPRGRPRRRRRAARVGRRPARRAGDRPRPRRAAAARSRPTSTTRSRCRSALVVERVRELAAPLGARPVEAELVGLVPEAALAGYPEDVPIRGFDPAPHTIERRLEGIERQPPPRPTRFEPMAQTKKKRRKQAQGDPGRPHRRQAPRPPAQPPGGESAGPLAPRQAAPSAATRRRPGAARSSAALVAAVIFFVLLLLLFKRPVGAVARPRRLHARLLHPGRLLHRPDDVDGDASGRGSGPAEELSAAGWLSTSRCSPSGRSPRTASSSAARAPTGS